MRSITSNWGSLFEIRLGWLRELLDLQYRSILLVMRAQLRQERVTNLRVLDVGSGNAPYRSLFSAAKEYVTLDPHSREADYRRQEDLPPGKQFDLILVVEVLEHVEAPAELLRSLGTALAADGRIWISVPFSARVHGAPRDYWRWTPDGMAKLVGSAGFELVSLVPRGTDLSVLFSKLFFLFFRWSRRPLGFIPAMLLMAATLPLLLPLAHLSLWLNLGSPEDPLGYFAVVGERHE